MDTLLALGYSILFPFFTYFICIIFGVNFKYDTRYEFHFTPSLGHLLVMCSIIFELIIYFTFM